MDQRIKNQPIHVDPRSRHDRLLVIGSGVAGLATALVAAETHGVAVTVLCAGAVPTDCNSYWAQGGIIYQSDRPNEVELLVQDICRAGAGLCVDAAVQKVAHQGPNRVRQLLLGGKENETGDYTNSTPLNNKNNNNNTFPFAQVPFDRDAKSGALSLCLEASHSAPRILHTADHTGATLTNHLAAAAARHPLITIQPNTVVTDLIVENNNINNNNICLGVETLQKRGDDWFRSVDELAFHGVVLASGGLAGIYQHSTNPLGFNALGSSVALATRASVPTRDLEFVQFHPTALSWPNTSRFLLTEALRGEGAILRDAAGRAFCRDFHPDGELAPRDVVARAVFETSVQQQGKPVYLDITHRDSDWVHQRFPTICQHLKSIGSGLDLAKDWLPIIPAAHYTCGGIVTDLDGCTSMPGLYAAGEAARTGLHGGNRLASTSLLEGLVFGASVADHVGSDVGRDRSGAVAAAIKALDTGDDDSKCQSAHNVRAEKTSMTAQKLLRYVRQVMWDHVGVTRTESGLTTAISRLHELREEAEELFRSDATFETAAVRDATCAGYVVAHAALANPNSVGAHCIVKELDSDSEDEAEVLAMASA